MNFNTLSQNLLCYNQFVSDIMTGLITGLISGIVTGLIVAIIIHLIKQKYWKIKIGKSLYSGCWVQKIYKNDDDDYSGEPIKIDEYLVDHKKFKYTGKLTINISGTIRRLYPTNQSNRTWDFLGYLDGDVLTILYQSKEGQKSRGCIYVKLQYHQTEKDDFRGFYLEEHKDGTIDKNPLIICKVEE